MFPDIEKPSGDTIEPPKKLENGIYGIQKDGGTIPEWHTDSGEGTKQDGDSRHYERLSNETV